MKQLSLSLLFVLLLSTVALAGGPKGSHHYVGLQLAYQSLLETDLGSNDQLTDAALKAADAKMEFDDFGYGVSGIVGYKWSMGPRLEVELNYFKSDVDKVTSDVGNTELDGYVDMKSLMVNALWEFENDTDWYSFLGLGTGYGWSKGTLEGGGDEVSGTSSTPLFQPILGFGYHFTEHVSLDVNYKFIMGLKKLDYDDLEGDYRAHRLGVGLRYNF